MVQIESVYLENSYSFVERKIERLHFWTYIVMRNTTPE